jgi:hypothetical protein
MLEKPYAWHGTEMEQPPFEDKSILSLARNFSPAVAMNWETMA